MLASETQIKSYLTLYRWKSWNDKRLDPVPVIVVTSFPLLLL